MMLSTLSTKIDVASNLSDFRLIRARTVYLLKESLEGYRNLKAVEGMSKKSYSFSVGIVGMRTRALLKTIR